jgi:DNA-binding NtrC family response regulator
MEVPKVLVVDDDENVLESVCEILSFYGYRVVATQTVAEAQLALVANDPDVMVCDWNLRGERALSLLEFTRAHHPHVGRVLMTGSAEDDWSLLMARSLVHVALTKPVSPSDLRHAITIARTTAIAITH